MCEKLKEEKMGVGHVDSIPLLERWELYRHEMVRTEKTMAKFAKNFLDLGAYEDASRCAIKAEGLKFIIGRMPSSNK